MTTVGTDREKKWGNVKVWFSILLNVFQDFFVRLICIVLVKHLYFNLIFLIPSNILKRMRQHLFSGRNSFF